MYSSANALHRRHRPPAAVHRQSRQPRLLRGAATLQAIYDAHSGADGWQVTKSGYAKHVLRKLDREQASQLIDDLNAL